MKIIAVLKSLINILFEGPDPVKLQLIPKLNKPEVRRLDV